MVKEKLIEMELEFDMESILSDFELNIMKAVDQMMPNVDILGCFFFISKRH